MVSLMVCKTYFCSRIPFPTFQNPNTITPPIASSITEGLNPRAGKFRCTNNVSVCSDLFSSSANPFPIPSFSHSSFSSPFSPTTCNPSRPSLTVQFAHQMLTNCPPDSLALPSHRANPAHQSSLPHFTAPSQNFKNVPCTARARSHRPEVNLEASCVIGVSIVLQHSLSQRFTMLWLWDTLVQVKYGVSNQEGVVRIAQIQNHFLHHKRQ